MRPIQPISRGLLVVLPFLLAGAAFAADQAVIESIDGATSVEVATPQGVQQLQEGEELAPGDQLRTSGTSSARILYPDGSQLLVGNGTQVRVQQNDGSTQWNQLDAGHVHAIVAKPKDLPPPGSKPRFVIRTKTAVLGVRGTEFAVDAGKSGESSEIHTLDGVVDVAKDERGLLSGKGYAVRRDQFVQSRAGGALEAPRAFDRAKYLAQLKREHPRLEALRRRIPKTRDQLRKLRMKARSARQALQQRARRTKAGAQRTLRRQQGAARNRLRQVGQQVRKPRVKRQNRRQRPRIQQGTRGFQRFGR